MDADVIVIGAGFGGLGAALALAEGGARVVLCEALAYPGGCASTFTRGGARYETGATLFAGLGEGQFLRQIRDRYAPELRLDFPDPVLELRAPGLRLPVPASRAAFVEGLCALPGAPVAALRRFFADQGRQAAALWALFDSPELLPPWSPAALWGLAGWGRRAGAPALLGLARQVGRPLGAVLRSYALHTWAPLRTWLDALCQITVQTSADRAEAPFALAAMDYPFRGAGHVHGGIGGLAWAMARAVEARGGQLKLACRVRGLKAVGGVWQVDARGQLLRAPQVVANLLPQGLRELLGEQEGVLPPLDALAARVRGGWSAAMLYLRLRPGALSRAQAHHLELVADTGAPFVEGNHVFCSISATDEGRCEDGGRTVTVSTHLPAGALRGLPEPEQAAKVSQVQENMRQTLRALAPELWAAVVGEMPASARTWARFTRRDEGLVGGVPRVVGLSHYSGLWPHPVRSGLFLVGDSVFPGQSALAAALGGHSLARTLLGRTPRPALRSPDV